MSSGYGVCCAKKLLQQKTWLRKYARRHRAAGLGKGVKFIFSSPKHNRRCILGSGFWSQLKDL